MPQRPFAYDKYLTSPPTPLMEHLEEWIRDKTGFDPSKDARTKEDAFAMGVRLTVALRNHHQESEENQGRLAESRRAANQRDAAAIARREARLAAGVASRGRLPKTAALPAEPPAEPAPKRRGRPKKTTEPVDVAVEPAAAPKRRGRPKKAAEPTETATVTPIRRRAETTAAETTENATSAPAARTARRRPVRRKPEAAF